jgi:hypothetical protein
VGTTLGTSVRDDSNVMFSGTTAAAPRVIVNGAGVTSAGMQLRTNGALRWDINAPSGSASLAFNDGTSNQLTLGNTGGALLGAAAGGVPAPGALNATGVQLNGTQFARGDGAPTCTNNCGTTPSITGNNSTMRVTMGATGTPATPFLVLFTTPAWTGIPACLAQIDTPGTTAATVTRANATTTGVQINTVVNPPVGAVYSIHCLGVG